MHHSRIINIHTLGFLMIQGNGGLYKKGHLLSTRLCKKREPVCRDNSCSAVSYPSWDAYQTRRDREQAVLNNLNDHSLQFGMKLSGKWSEGIVRG